MRSQGNPIARCGRLAAGVVIAVMVLSGAGVFGIYSQHLTTVRAFESVDRLRAVELALRELEVGFKVEVQEWKNFLLRGQTPEGYNTWRETYFSRVRKTELAFEEVKKLSGTTPEEKAAIIAMADLHAANAKLYVEAISSYQPGDPNSIFKVDALVRGKDRDLASNLSKLADQLRERAKGVADQLEAEGEQRYERFRTFLGSIAFLTFVLTLCLAFQISSLGRSLNKTH